MMVMPPLITTIRLTPTTLAIPAATPVPRSPPPPLPISPTSPINRPSIRPLGIPPIKPPTLPPHPLLLFLMLLMPALEFMPREPARHRPNQRRHASMPDLMAREAPHRRAKETRSDVFRALVVASTTTTTATMSEALLASRAAAVSFTV